MQLVIVLLGVLVVLEVVETLSPHVKLRLHGHGVTAFQDETVCFKAKLEDDDQVDEQERR